MSSRKQCLLDTRRLRNIWTHTLRQQVQGLHRSELDGVPALREEVDTSSHLQLTTAQRKNQLLQWSLTGDTNHSKGRLCIQQYMAYEKWTQWSFQKSFLILLCLGIFYLLGFLLLYYGFRFCVFMDILFLVLFVLFWLFICLFFVLLCFCIFETEFHYVVLLSVLEFTM